MSPMRRRPVVVAAPRKQSPGLVGTMAKTAVVAGTATAAVGATSAVMHKVAGPSGAEQQAAAQQQAAAAPQDAAPAGLTSEQIEQLKQIAALKDSGVLTEEEFEAQKAKILASA